MLRFNLLDHIKGNDTNSVLWLFNIGVEGLWNQGLSIVKDVKENIVVNHMDEILLLIAKKQDVVILRSSPDLLYLDDLKMRGFEIPNIIYPNIHDETKHISEIILEDIKLMNDILLIKQKVDKLYFVPYGVSELEERISKVLDLPLIGGKADLNALINSKLFSRKLARKLNFELPEGFVCHTIEEIRRACNCLLNKYNSVIIKYPYEASGKGLFVIRDFKIIEEVLLIIKRISSGMTVISWIVEAWYDKKADINYQLYISSGGIIDVFSVKEQLLNGTIYNGSIVPPLIEPNLYLKCIECGKIIGMELFKMGYNGVAGIDAIITKNNTLIPIIEINGRFTLSTYVSFLTDRFNTINLMSFYKRIKLNKTDNYMKFRDKLKIYTENNGTELFIYNSQTLNYSITHENGRLFCVCYADAREKLLENYRDICNIVG